MKRTVRWTITVLGLVVFFILGGLLPGKPLAKRTMIIAFGIDSVGRDEVEITAQILAATKSEEHGSKTKIVTATDATMGGAMNKISEKSDMDVALSHCNVVILGENIAKSPDVYAVLNYLIGNAYLSDNAFLFTAEGTAKKLLSSKAQFGDNTGLYLQNLIGKHGDYNDITQKTLQKFIVDYHRVGNANWLPFIKRIKSEDEGEYLFNLNSTLIFKKNRFVTELNDEETAALNYVVRTVKKGKLETEGDNGEKILLYLINKNVKRRFDLEKKEAKINLTFDAVLKEIIDTTNNDLYVDRKTLSENEIARIGKKISGDVENLFLDMRKRNVDLFGFRERFLSKYGKAAGDIALRDINLTVKTRIKLTA